MALSLREQLFRAFKVSGMTLRELMAASGLTMDATCLSRKLKGKQSLRTHEAEAIARALKVRIAAGRREARAA